ncbi:YIEGIA family protein [Mechercharimyces sp. CAU 1602]|uniref:YIEGIA family protein n=1 Tax=Mechercharimyces sp. CAU 1602 TaxID=2973933 RepID=UPI002163B0C7|nr:YIEGIA family protein [Mechercharimyces sp. CAU 1602]MCS1350926.1 YIEGIA family protein [Mechercharimyces sp. CAU 1602]
MEEELISNQYVIMIVTGIIMGTIARFSTIKEDYRQYPSYPNGYMIHVLTSFVAAFLGAVAIPALMTKNYVAVTFLALAIQQFRDIRKIEKESMQDLENTEYTYRGDAYIDGIAKTFEARNYFSLLVAFATSLTMQVMDSKWIWLNVGSGCTVGILILLWLKRFSKGKTVGDIATVRLGEVKVEGSELFVDEIYISNLLGTENARTMFQNEGIAAIIEPKENHLRITLDHFGQRQAILFEATRAMGVKRYHFTRKEYDTGKVVITLVPVLKNPDLLKETIQNTPLLENVKKSHSVMDTNFIGRR